MLRITFYLIVVIFTIFILNSQVLGYDTPLGHLPPKILIVSDIHHIK